MSSSCRGEVADAIAAAGSAHNSLQRSRLSFAGARAVNPAAYDAYLRGRLYFVSEFTKSWFARTRPNATLKTRSEKIRTSPWLTRGWRTHTSTWPLQELCYPGSGLSWPARESSGRSAGSSTTASARPDTLGELSSEFDWDWDEAERQFNRSIALAPSYSCGTKIAPSFLGSWGGAAKLWPRWQRWTNWIMDSVRRIPNQRPTMSYGITRT